LEHPQSSSCSCCERPSRRNDDVLQARCHRRERIPRSPIPLERIPHSQIPLKRIPLSRRTSTGITNPDSTLANSTQTNSTLSNSTQMNSTESGILCMTKNKTAWSNFGFSTMSQLCHNSGTSCHACIPLLIKPSLPAVISPY
jgi:hypothetical protein